MYLQSRVLSFLSHSMSIDVFLRLLFAQGINRFSVLVLYRCRRVGSLDPGILLCVQRSYPVSVSMYHRQFHDHFVFVRSLLFNNIPPSPQSIITQSFWICSLSGNASQNRLSLERNTKVFLVSPWSLSTNHDINARDSVLCDIVSNSVKTFPSSLECTSQCFFPSSSIIDLLFYNFKLSDDFLTWTDDMDSLRRIRNEQNIIYWKNIWKGLVFSVQIRIDMTISKKTHRNWKNRIGDIAKYHD